MSTKISIIIPAHNSGNTITKNLNSILSSKLDCVEVIVVNNGSSDNTLEIVKRYQKTDQRVVCIDSPKASVSNARNLGIKKAHGKWIVFVDADDQLYPGAIETFVHNVSNHNDLILFNYTVNNEPIKPYGNDMDYSHLFKRMLRNPTKCMTVWNKMFRLNLILKNKVFFNSDLKYSEDSEFLIRYMLISQTVKASSEITYEYNVSSGSTVRKYNSNSIYEYTKAIKIIRKELMTYPKLSEELNLFILMQLNLIMVHNVFSTNNPENFFSKVGNLKKITKEELFNVPIRGTKLNILRGARFLPIIFIKFHFYFCSGIIYTLRVWQNNKKAN